jgi:Arc/MetJ-type ribon-helix-helix transcriptional regulator
MAARSNRRKISTTVAPETHAFLKSLVRRGKVANLAEAVDRAVSFARHTESRERLEAATAAYYDSLSGDALRGEQELENAASKASALTNPSHFVI